MNTQGYQNPSESSQKIRKNNPIKDKNNRLMMGLLLLNTISSVKYLHIFNGVMNIHTFIVGDKVNSKKMIYCK